MEFKIWDNANKIMYHNAELIDDDKWNFGRLHHNIHCTTCVTVGKVDKNNNNIFTFDMLEIDGLMFYVDEIIDGVANIRGLNANIVESLANFDSKDIKIIGSYLELEIGRAHV